MGRGAGVVEWVGGGDSPAHSRQTATTTATRSATRTICESWAGWTPWCVCPRREGKGLPGLDLASARGPADKALVPSYIR